MAAAGGSDDAPPKGSAPTQPALEKKYELEHPDGTSDILSTYEAKGRMKGKVVLVTGGSQAIGKTIVEVLALEGASVYFCSRRKEQGEEVRKALNAELVKRGETERAFYQSVDVGEEEQLKSWIDSVGEKEGRIDVIIPNAAAFVFGHIEDVTTADWEKILKVNVIGYANCTKFSLPYMRRAGKGSVVNVASISSHVAQPSFTPYNTSKGAIMQMTRCMAMDLGPENIRVNALCPGTIDTPATSLHAAKLGLTKAELVKDTVKAHFIKRLGSTLDCAQAALFLASDESSFVTGTFLMLDGGYTAH